MFRNYTAEHTAITNERFTMWLLQKQEIEEDLCITNELCISEDIEKLKDYALSETDDLDLSWNSRIPNRYYTISTDGIEFYITQILSI